MATAEATDPGSERRSRARVLLVSQRVPDSNALGGVEIHVADLASHLGAEVQPFAAHPRAGTLVVERFCPSRREIAWLPADNFGAALHAAVLEAGADVLHVHSPELGPDALVHAARSSGARVVVTLHDLAWARPEAAPLLAAADCVIAPSRFVRDLVSETHPAIAARTRTLRWGVLPQARVPGGTAGKLRVAVVGVLVAGKGAERLPELIRACSHLGIEWHLFGATEGRSLGAIRRAAPGLRAHGAYRRSELGRRLAEAKIDLVVLPSIVPESFCMVLSECIAAGVPVVASSLGALEERVRDEECGWTFDPWRADSLSATLERLVDRRELTAVARRLKDRPVYPPAAMAADHAGLYLELAENRRAGAKVPVPARVAARTPRGSDALRRTWRALRQSRFYRDLPVRRLLTEELRARVEQGASALLDRLRR